MFNRTELSPINAEPPTSKPDSLSGFFNWYKGMCMLPKWSLTSTTFLSSQKEQQEPIQVLQECTQIVRM